LIRVKLSRKWILTACGLVLVAAVAGILAIVLSGGSKQASSAELARTIATSTDAKSQADAARELAARLEPASVATAVRLAGGSAQGKAGLNLLRSDLIGLYDEPGASLDQRRGALLCLGWIGDETATTTVVDALVSARNPALQEAAASALTGENLSPAAVERVVVARQDATGTAAQARLERLIVAIGKPAVLPLLNVARDEQAPESSWELGLVDQIGLPALPLLRARLAGNDFQTSAIAALGLLGLRKSHPAQIKPLVPAITAKMLAHLGAPVPGEYEIRVLAEIGKPAVSQLMEIRRKDYTSLSPAQQKLWSNADWSLAKIAELNPKAASPLLSALAHKDYGLIADFSMVFIMLGKPGSEQVLIDALDSSGDSLMALNFLNSGNQRLVQAAKSWASSHGYTITYGSGAAMPSSWGTASG
jgi:hypothetical protein